MRVYVCLFVVLFMSFSTIAFASVEISNPRAIMDESIIKKSNQRPDFCARLSPDGKYILFPQLVDAIEETYKLYLQNIETADEIEIPIELPSGYETVFTRYNFFNHKGDKLALLELSKEQNLRQMEIAIFDIPSKNLTKTGITGRQVMVQYDYTGKSFSFSINNSFFGKATLDDFKSGEAIMSGWLHSCSPKTPYATIFVRSDFGRDEDGFSLLNLETNESFNLPVHRKNGRLDDITSQWSSDGLYMFYFDIKLNDEGKQEPIVRVWDVISNTEKAIVQNVKCLGPGPADNLMIMISTDENISGSNLRLYDIRTGELTSFGEGEIKGIHAWKNRIAYVKTENGAGTVYVADLKEVKESD